MKATEWLRPFIEELRDVTDEDVGKTRRTTTVLVACNALLVAAGLACQTCVVIATRATTPLNVLLASTWALLLLISIWRPRTGSPALSIAFAGLLLGYAGKLSIETPGTTTLAWLLNVLPTVLSLVLVIIEINLPLRNPSWSRDDIAEPGSEPTSRLRTPEDNLTIWQWYTVSWMKPLIRLGKKRQLNSADVWFLGYEFQHRHLHDAFRELKGSVLRRVLRANWIDLVLLTLLAFAELAADFASPFILQALLKAMDNLAYDKAPAIRYALLMLVVRLVDAQVEVLALWFGRRAYERSRGEMITMLYEKTLKRKIVGEVPEKEVATTPTPSEPDVSLNGSEANTEVADGDSDGLLAGPKGQETVPKTFLSRAVASAKEFLSRKKPAPTVSEAPQSASVGKILNVLRNDVYEVAQRFWEFQTLIFAPVGFIIAVALVWKLLGWASLVGAAVVVLSQILNALLARGLIKWEKLRRQATDDKFRRITQYIEAIRHLRWYGWHPSWLQHVLDARQKELNLKIITQIWNLAIILVNQFGSALLPVAAFFAFTALAGEDLRVDVAFPALQLFIYLQKSLKDIPRLITVLLNAKVSIDRIESFMNEPDKPENPLADSDNQLELKDASFGWPGSTQSVLRNVNLKFPPGLSLVVGRVGAGKTALLQGLLGELDLQQGHLVKPADTPIAYCLQTPWLESMTIRDNILFNTPYDDDRYKRTVDACALTPDLATFPQGDLSAIGENGIGLSGGQKARVALARAIYSRAPILLLDDPISALDQQTAEWIVRRCLVGDLVEGRTIVLATHRTDLCQGVAVQTIEVSGATAEPVEGEIQPDDYDLAQVMSDRRSDEEQKQVEQAAIRDKFEDEEHREHGGVQFSVYWVYIKAGKLKWWFALAIFASLFQFLNVAESWFLKEWGEAYNRGREQLLGVLNFPANIRILETPLSGIFRRLPNPSDDVYPWLKGYLLVVSIGPIALVLSQAFVVLITYLAGKKLFQEMMERVSNAPFRYYDATPIGRLLNRLISDVGVLDGGISSQLWVVIFQAVAWLASVFVFAGVTPTFLVFSILLTATFVWIFLQFLPSSQSLRRLEMVSLSPLISNFGALLGGLTTVRAFCAEPAFLSRVIGVVDEFQKNDHFYWSLQGWLMYRFDVLSCFSTFALTMLAVYSDLTPGLTAFVLVAAQRFVASTHQLCRSYGQLQLDFVSVERVVELLQLDVEPPGDVKPPASWPKYGAEIEFENVTIRYIPEAAPAISDVSLVLEGGKHTAIVGRTGSGKSTLSLALLATTPLSTGRIMIDGIDISRVDKITLRSRITFLAQDPILFPGSLRFNLDPQSEFSDTECISALSLACLDTRRFTLDFEVAAHGHNLSQGQRQLVSLARALLRKSAVVIMDEATASVDLETAERVYRVVKDELQRNGSTVVSVAHRRGAMEGVDGSIVLVGGKVESVEGCVSQPVV
jgi:ABC-type multidrug transport system fused ATPase/permease subunit